MWRGGSEGGVGHVIGVVGRAWIVVGVLRCNDLTDVGVSFCSGVRVAGGGGREYVERERE